MKVKKALFKVVAIIAVISTSLSTMAFAAEPSVDWSTVEPSQEFIEYYSDFFENPDVYWVTDKNGVDVTSTFWTTYYSDYLSNSFNHIFAYVMNNDCTLEWDSTPQGNTAISTQATFLTYTISHTFYKSIDISKLTNGTTVGVRYTVTGSYTVNDGYDRIISQTDAELDINKFSHDNDHPCYLESTTTSQSIGVQGVQTR